MAELGLFYEILYNVLTICLPIGIIFIVKGAIKDNYTYVWIGIAFWCVFLYAGFQVIETNGFWLSFPAYILSWAYMEKKLPELREAQLKILER